MKNNFPSMMNKPPFPGQGTNDNSMMNMGSKMNNQLNSKKMKAEKKKLGFLRNNPLAQFAGKKDTVIVKNIPEYYNVVNYLMNYFKKFGDISNVSTFNKEKMAAIQYKKDSDAKKAVNYEGKPFDLNTLVLYIAAEGDPSVGSTQASSKPERKNTNDSGQNQTKPNAPPPYPSQKPFKGAHPPMMGMPPMVPNPYNFNPYMYPNAHFPQYMPQNPMPYNNYPQNDSKPNNNSNNTKPSNPKANLSISQPNSNNQQRAHTNPNTPINQSNPNQLFGSN